MSKLYFALLSLASLQPLMSAQTIATPCLPFAPENTIEWPTSGGFGTPQDFGRLVSADLNGDQVTDGVVNSNGVAVVLWNLATYDALQPIQFMTQPPPANISDLATLPGAGLNGSDALLMTDYRGLLRVKYKENGVFYDPEVVLNPLHNVLWKNAAAIHVVDLGGDSFPDVIAVSSDQHSVLVAFGTASGGFVHQATIVQSTNTTRDVVAADMDLNGIRELVVLSPRALKTYSLAGTLIYNIPYVSTTGCITRFSAGTSPATVTDHVAWTRGTSSGASELIVLGTTMEQLAARPLTFMDAECVSSSIQPVALLAGHYNEGHNDDLLLVHEGGPTAVVLIGSGPVQFFTTTGLGGYDVVPLAAGPVGQTKVGIPAFSQLDGDGEDFEETQNPDDLAFPVVLDGVRSVNVHLGLPFIHGWVGQPIVTSADIVMENTEYGNGLNSPGKLRLALDVPPMYSNYTHVDLILWRQPSGNPMPGLGLIPIYHGRHELHRESGAVYPPHQWIDVEHPFQTGLCWGDPNTVPDDYPIIYTEFRFEKAGPPLVRSRIFVGGFRMKHCPSGEEFTYLTDLGFSNVEPYELLEVNGLTGPVPLSKAMVGIYVPMASLPAFATGTPQPGTASNEDGLRLFWPNN